MGGADIVLCWIGWGEPELAQALDLRERVFCGEQGVAREEELDGLDDTALHLVALEPGGEVIGTLRMLITEGRAKIGRVAVERRLRRRRVASRMLDLALHEARERGCKRARLAAQVDAIGLYRAAGFAVESEPFEEAGITHVWMGRALAAWRDR